MGDNAAVREGQKVVVGKTSVGRSGDTLSLVVTAKVVDCFPKLVSVRSICRRSEAPRRGAGESHRA